MKVLTAAEMREVDRRTIDLGLDGPLLMENAGHRVVEVLAEKFGPLRDQRVLILCGKGNNGGDGLVVARQLLTRYGPRALWVVLAEAAPGNLAGFLAAGGSVAEGLSAEMRTATLVIDALLGTGLTGPPREPYAGLIRAINEDFPLARVVAVDIPSGMASDYAETEWPHVKADATVTFTAPKVGQVLLPNSQACGELVVGAIGSRDELLPDRTLLSEPAMFRELFVPRERTGHKGTYGHVLVVGGAHGKTGAAAMTSIAALRAGAGLVTMCSDMPAPYPEIMHEPLGGIEEVQQVAVGKTVLAVGPGLGINAMVGRLIETSPQPVILDADGLNSVAGEPLPRREDLVLTPHPGEMSRLTGLKTSEIQESRLQVAREFARARGVTLVLKGANTLTAFPDGQVVINPTGNPGMATGGSGDVLTGIIAGLVAQFPDRLRTVVPAAVWLHGRAGDLAARALGEQSMIATDMLQFLPQAMNELRH